jgi:hypothetical protein
MAFGDDHIGRPKKVDKIVTEKMLPVLIGNDYQHVMGQGTIEQIAASKDAAGRDIPARVTITIISEGPAAQELGDFVAAHEIVALSFGGVPVRPVRKEN